MIRHGVVVKVVFCRLEGNNKRTSILFFDRIGINKSKSLLFGGDRIGRLDSWGSTTPFDVNLIVLTREGIISVPAESSATGHVPVSLIVLSDAKVHFFRGVLPDVSVLPVHFEAKGFGE